MMEKYVPMVRDALEEIESHYKDQKEYQGNSGKCRIVHSRCGKISGGRSGRSGNLEYWLCRWAGRCIEIGKRP